MKTNQKFYMLRQVLFIVLLCFTNLAIGQKENKIIDILDEDGDSFQGTVKITFRKATDNVSKEREVKINDILDSEAAIDVKSPYITLILKSFNGTIVEMPSNTILDFKITDKNEKYNLLKCEPSKKVKINKLKKYLGSLITTGLTNRLQALTYGTTFSINLNDQDLNVKLDTGKLKLDHLIKREIIDENVLGNDGKRALFIRENRKLTVNDGVYPSPDINFDSLPVLTDNNEIKKFLHKPFITQKRDLINMGEFSKRAVKDLEVDASKDEALLSFEKALDTDELTIEFIIQSALLFADSYLFNEEIEKSKIWLEVGIHYSDILFKTKQKILENQSINDSSESNELDKALTNALRYEMLTANEFSAWAYDIKLKLYGCLENPNENPSKYRSNANKLLKAIEGKDN